MEDGTSRTVVVGFEGFGSSSAALHWAAREAADSGARLHVVCAWRAAGLRVGSHTEATAAQLAREAQAVARGLVPAGVQVTQEAVHGPAADVLVQRARRADVLVLGSRAPGGPAARLLGGVSHRCVHRAGVPVVLLGPHARSSAESRCVLAALEGRVSAAALTWGVGRARRAHHRLHVLDSWCSPTLGLEVTLGHGRADTLRHAVRAHQELIERIGRVAAGVTVTDLLVEGHEEDVEYARTGNGDLLVVPADQVRLPPVRAVRCPVVLVPRGGAVRTVPEPAHTASHGDG